MCGHPTLQLSFKLNWPAAVRQTSSSSAKAPTAVVVSTAAWHTAYMCLCDNGIRQERKGINTPYRHRQQPPPDHCSQWTLQSGSLQLEGWLSLDTEGWFFYSSALLVPRTNEKLVTKTLRRSVERKVKQSVTKIKGVKILDKKDHGSVTGGLYHYVHALSLQLILLVR